MSVVVSFVKLLSLRRVPLFSKATGESPLRFKETAVLGPIVNRSSWTRG